MNFPRGPDRRNRAGRALSDHKSATNYAAKVIASMPLADGLTPAKLEAAMARLFAAGAIKVGQPLKRENRHHARGIVIVHE